MNDIAYMGRALKAEAELEKQRDRYFEQQALHTEATGMLAAERDQWKGKLEGERILYTCQLETSAALRREITKLRGALDSVCDAVSEDSRAYAIAINALDVAK